MSCPIYGSQMNCDPISHLPDCVIDGWVGNIRACGSIEVDHSGIDFIKEEMSKEVKRISKLARRESMFHSMLLKIVEALGGFVQSRFYTCTYTHKECHCGEWKTFTTTITLDEFGLRTLEADEKYYGTANYWWQPHLIRIELK